MKVTLTILVWASLCCGGLGGGGDQDDFVSANLIVVKETGDFATVGQRSAFTCTLPQSDQVILQCFIATPNQEIWEVIDGDVYDGNGVVVPGYTAQVNGDAAKTCGIGIDAVKAADLGNERVCLQQKFHFFFTQTNESVTKNVSFIVKYPVISGCVEVLLVYLYKFYNLSNENAELLFGNPLFFGVT